MPSAPVSFFWLSGAVVGWGAAPAPVSQDNVTLVGRSCGSVESPASCPYVGSISTSANGSFRFAVLPGEYIVYAHNTSRWGGAWAAVNITTHDAIANLELYPWVPYGNATLVLPGWNNLSAYAANCNDAGTCGPGIGGTQTPILSWTQSGAYYVNASDDLVFYSFTNGSVRLVAPWLLLYDDLMLYKGIENTEWITSDGAYVYEFGCYQDCAHSINPVVAFYAVNTTTGRSFQHNFTSFTAAQTRVNGETQMLGENGNSSIAVVITSVGTVYAYNIWTGREWTLGQLPFFEANNVYWLPTFNSLIDIEANGSSLDRIVELSLTGAMPGTTLKTSFSGTYASGFVSNGVDGLYLNLSARRLFVTEGGGGGPTVTQSFRYDARGILTGEYTTYPEQSLGAWPNDTVPPNAWSSEHRPLLTSYGPMVQGLWDGLFNNGSWQYEPATGEYLDSNISFDHAGPGPKFVENSQSPASVEGLFFNSSYAIVSESVNCRTNGTACPIRGTSPGTVPGTIWWTWRLGLPEFPFPGAGTIAETLAPGPLSLNATNTTRTITVHWVPAVRTAAPILNYTVYWGPTGGASDHSADVWAQNSSYTIRGLLPSTNLSILVQAWNLHGHNQAVGLVASTHSAPPGARVESFVATPTPVDAGMRVTFSVTASGGAAPLAYSYSGLPAGCEGGNAAVFSCVPSSPGSYLVQLIVQDFNGQLTTSTLALNVSPALRVVVSAATNATDVGLPIPVAATSEGSGTPPVLFRWVVAGIATPGATFAAPAASAGALGLLLIATDSAGAWTSVVWTYTVNPDPRAISFRAQPDPATVGATVAFDWELSGGTPPLSATLGGLPPGCPPAPENLTSTSCTIRQSGVFHPFLHLSDAVGFSSNFSLSLTVTDANDSARGAPPLDDLGTWILFSGALSASTTAVLLRLARPTRR